ncbi:hypothetical protein SAMN05421848_1667 [Kushneria avicenniae]|uniref:Lipoprotein n=1 Tax=Kushneria avicenniae TaxID=402385 RepID=A0A1I1JN41_9GAMM|nr:hypothetical protein [Kushneria avicenniae]SFC50039.1 hypothetical protein SAMN05421848_1667 [Kushneria avicenniae]
MRKFTSIALVASTTVVLTACSSNDHSMSQQQLAEYCGIDTAKLLEDMRSANPRVESVKIQDTDCTTQVVYKDETGQRHYAEADNHHMMSLLAAGGAGALLGYMMSGPGRSSFYDAQMRRRDRDRDHSTFFSPYIASNSRALGAYRTGRSASRINVSGRNGQVTTRSNPFRGTSSTARSSAYRGG